MTELEQLQTAGIEVLRNQRPEKPPLMFLIAPLSQWIEARLIELIRQSSFPEARASFNPVFIHLPADGCRLTELAEKAGMTKQAIGETVEELVRLGYLTRFPDPKDGRAKLILRTEKGLQAHRDTLAAFARIDRELSEMLGAFTLDSLRGSLAKATEAVRSGPRD
ncbi:MAG: MarR family transcriptional regulator [Paracoccaceae bacterium]|nr:MarR family transcriptional regulator [Paracoccaceae bacterium]